MPWVAVLFLGLSLTDVLVDYLVNHQLYFAVASWNDARMAELWDQHEGRDGLAENQRIVAAIDQFLRREPNWAWTGKKVLDMGCGNGWLSRWLARQGANVVGIDKSKQLLAIADGYEQGSGRVHAGSIKYQETDFTSRNKKALGQFDLILSLFSIQDCYHIGRAFDFVAQTLSTTGSFVVVFEDDRRLRDKETHTMSTRRWLRSDCQLICWRKQGDDEGKWDHRYVTVTRHWGVARYQNEASSRKLEVNAIGLSGDKFVALECRHQGKAAVAHPSGPVPKGSVTAPAEASTA